MPEAYRLWSMCERHNKLFLSGGIADQPHILMLEFAVCANVAQQYQPPKRPKEKPGAS